MHCFRQCTFYFPEISIRLDSCIIFTLCTPYYFVFLLRLSHFLHDPTADAVSTAIIVAMLHARTTEGYCPVTSPALNTYLRLQCLSLTRLGCLLIGIVPRCKPAYFITYAFYWSCDIKERKHMGGLEALVICVVKRFVTVLKKDCKNHPFLSQRSSGCSFHDVFSYLDFKHDSYSAWCFNRFCYCITSIFIVIDDNLHNINMYDLFHIEFPSISLYQNNFSRIKLMKGKGIRKHSLHEKTAAWVR